MTIVKFSEKSAGFSGPESREEPRSRKFGGAEKCSYV